MPHPRSQLPRDLTHDDSQMLDSMPKAVIFGIAKHLAALLTGEEPDEALRSGAYLDRIHEEWVALHRKRIIQQEPPQTYPRVRARARKVG